MFNRLGYWIGRQPLLFVFAWLLAVIGGGIWAVRTENPPPADVGSFLPADSAHSQAMQLLRKAFPEAAARSRIVVIAQRTEGLQPADIDWLDHIANAAQRLTASQVLSPKIEIFKPRLVSPDHKSAMSVVNLASNFISPKTVQIVEQVEQIIADNAPPVGLTVEITGTAGIGRDYAQATETALHNTTWVTIVAVLVILILVYRSPLGAFVPLVSIGASVFLAFIVLAMLARCGWEISNIERIFAVVLLFGAGVDYALFWIAGYRERFESEADFASAAHLATRHAGPAILASAATTICGLTTMLATDLVPTRNAGKVLGVVLIIALLAALTLSPALARLLGRGLFWPRGLRAKPTVGQRFIWPLLADCVTRRPRTLLLGGTALLTILALFALRINFRFDSLSELPAGSSSSRGYEIARQHFSKGQLYSNNLLLAFDGQPGSFDDLKAISQSVTKRIAAMAGVHDVYSLDAPLGIHHADSIAPSGGKLFSRITEAFDLSKMPMVRRLYLSENNSVLRFEVLIDHLPFSPEAMELVTQAGTSVDELAAELRQSDRGLRILWSGPTPYVIAVRAIAGADQVRVMVLATLVIGLIVFALIRDLPLTLFMVLATWLTYGATLALSQLFFVHVLGEPGLDWKVRLIVFVIVVAVGQDYNIFLVARLFQEPAEVSDTEAARRAIVRTGSVISSCGLIMAATLGSLWAGELALLRQIGFALALGILIDTFLVRPLLVPSFFLATGRRRTSTRRWGRSPQSPKSV